MMKIVIVEDEKIAADHLQKLLSEIIPEADVMAVIPSVSKAVTWFSTPGNRADLVFMDIQLTDDISFRIFEQTEIEAPVVFTTAYDHYAIRAFKLNSIDYLLKPIEKSDLSHALRKFKSLHAVKGEELLRMINELKNKSEYQKRFMVSTGNRIRSVSIEEIAWFQSEGRYVRLTANDGAAYTIDFTMDKLEDVLDPEIFFRINRQFILNISAIRQMHLYTKGRIKTELQPPCNEEVIVSIDKSAAFKKWLNR